MDRIPAANRIVAEYEFPYLAHTPMEPLNATTAVGECPVPVIAPAVVNALARLTGKRYRSLPLVSIWSMRPFLQ